MLFGVHQSRRVETEAALQKDTISLEFSKCLYAEIRIEGPKIGWFHILRLQDRCAIRLISGYPYLPYLSPAGIRSGFNRYIGIRSGKFQAGLNFLCGDRNQTLTAISEMLGSQGKLSSSAIFLSRLATNPRTLPIRRDSDGTTVSELAANRCPCWSLPA